MLKQADALYLAGLSGELGCVREMKDLCIPWEVGKCP